MPPLASSNLPGRRSTAPVNEPFSWPYSSLSMRSRGIAAMLTVTNGPRARVEFAWIARATSSLPVPDSPMSRTVISVRATRPISL